MARKPVVDNTTTQYHLCEFLIAASVKQSSWPGGRGCQREKASDEYSMAAIFVSGFDSELVTISFVNKQFTFVQLPFVVHRGVRKPRRHEPGPTVWRYIVVTEIDKSQNGRPNPKRFTVARSGRPTTS